MYLRLLEYYAKLLIYEMFEILLLAKWSETIPFGMAIDILSNLKLFLNNYEVLCTKNEKKSCWPVSCIK